jgi:hypothetical protein
MKSKHGAPGFEDKGPNELRRKIVTGGGVVLAAAAAGGINEGIKFAERQGEEAEAKRLAQDEAEFTVLVEREKLRLIPLIRVGLEDQARQFKILEEARATLRSFLPQAEKLRARGEIEESLAVLGDATEQEERIRSRVQTRRGNHYYMLFDEANPFAEQLLTDDPALTSLATASLLYRRGSEAQRGETEDLPYWHNLAQGYIELKKLDRDRLREKLAAFFAYARKTSTVEVQPEQILYALLDDHFDFNLEPAAITQLLDQERPSWKEYPSTHNDRIPDDQYNNFTDLDIFELNKLRAVITQLQNPQFKSSVFAARDADLLDVMSEHGGVIPRPEIGDRLETYPGTPVGNGSYVNTTIGAMRSLISPAQFHFHATQRETPADIHGPSGIDSAYFSPEVVFTSLNGDTVLAHFFVSREKFDINTGPGHSQIIVCLGEIRKS